MADMPEHPVAVLGARLRAAARAGDLATARALADERLRWLKKLADVVLATPDTAPATIASHPRPIAPADLAALITAERAADAQLLITLAEQRQTLARQHSASVKMIGSGGRFKPAPLATRNAQR